MVKWKSLTPSEADEQTVVIDFCEIQKQHFPELTLIYHIPNGAGKLSKFLGALLKRMGLKPGVPDLFLPVIRGGYGGMYIEMKSLTGDLKPHQEAYIANLKKQGYYCIVSYGSEFACQELIAYMRGIRVRERK